MIGKLIDASEDVDDIIGGLQIQAVCLHKDSHKALKAGNTSYAEN